MAETKTKTTEPKTNIAAMRVPILLRAAEDGEQNFARVVVNGKPYQIPRGRQMLIPRPVYEVLARSEHAKLITRAYNAQQQEVHVDRRD